MNHRSCGWSCILSLLFVLLLLFALLVTSADARTSLSKFEAPAPAAVGDLDPSFGDQGKVLTPVGSGANALALQADGAIIAGGSTGTDFALVRYTAAGLPDAGFGTAGITTTDLGATDEIADLLIQPDGKIVAVGKSGDAWAMARYTITGTLDLAFGTGGINRFDCNMVGFNCTLEAVALQPDGKLIVAGGYGNALAVARYTQEGQLDPTFSDDGVQTTLFSSWAIARAVLLQPDGKIIAVGYTNSLGPAKVSGYALARYLPDGSLDPSFGQDGRVMSFDLQGAFINTAVLQGDQKIVGAGFSRVMRYHSDGTTDTTFGSNGFVDLAAMGIVNVTGLAAQLDGKLILVGQTSFAADSNAVLARLLPDGQLDLSFHGTGIVTTDFGGEDFAAAVIVQPDGKLVAAGHSDSNFALSRYNGDRFAFLPLLVQS